MSSSLYALFEEVGEARASISGVLRTTSIPGYSFFDGPMKAGINPPGEASAAVRFTYYAENYFRVFVSDLCLEFYREVSPPGWIADADEHLLEALLATRHFRLSRWVRTEEGWDDDDRRFVRIVDKGNRSEEFAIALAALNSESGT